MILIDGTYINNSGGKILLEYLIEVIIDEDIQDQFFFMLDRRLSSESADKIDVANKVQIAGGEGSRKKFYLSNIANFDVIFCFANVPPPINIYGKKVYIFFHNALILENKGSNYSFFRRLIFNLKRTYIKYKNIKDYVWIVQTKHIKKALKKLVFEGQEVLVLPIYDCKSFLNINQKLPKNDNNFLYVANGLEQKNHSVLLKAWEILYKRNKTSFSLHLTLSTEYPVLLNEIDRLTQKGVNILNHGHCTKEKIIELYATCNHFIMPSLSESFGLPIIEAATAGCNIIAADLEYVYDIIQPCESFNPNDPEDLIRAIFAFRNHRTPSKMLIGNKIKALMNLITDNV